jgi:hypothetical protein
MQPMVRILPGKHGQVCSSAMRIAKVASLAKRHLLVSHIPFALHFIQLKLCLMPQEITLVSFAILASQRQRAAVGITLITDLYIQTITRLTSSDDDYNTLEIAVRTRNYVQQLMKMISFAYETGFNELLLGCWHTALRERLSLQASIDVGGIVAAALAIDGKNLALDINSPALLQKTRLIALINSQSWNHQVILDILDNVRAPSAIFSVTFFLFTVDY